MSNPVSLNIDVIDQNNTGHLLVARSYSSNVRIRKSTISGGNTDKKIIYHLTGFVPEGRNIKIARLYFKSSSGKVFKKPPTLTVQNNNVDLRLIQVKTEDKFLKNGTTSKSKVFIYSLFYRSTRSTRSLDKINAYINYSDSVDIPTINKVRKVVFGSNEIKSDGEKRRVTVYGNPGLTVDIALNKLDNHIDAKGDVVNYTEQTILNITGLGIKKINDDGSPTIGALPSGETVTTTPMVIPSSGKYSFNVDFPSVTFKQTQLNGSRTAESRVIFDDLTGVRVGDVLYSGVTRLGKVTVLNPLGNNANQCDISSPITISDNVGVVFKRANDYNLNVYCKTGSDYKSGLASGIKSTDPTFVLKQYLDPALNLKVIANSGYTITHVNDVATSFSDGEDYIKEYVGRTNKGSKDVKLITSVLKEATIKLTINAHSTNYFTANRVPHFSTISAENTSDIPNIPSSTNVTVSDFTNTDPQKNGGTRFRIYNITSVLSADGGTSNGICTLTFDISVSKWGRKDVDVAIDLNDLLTLSA
tara:strand:- start:1747 stop:3336 length:1590 start_codon:yes stop_codon:yes gene_type:complete